MSALTTIDPVLRVQDICRLLKVSEAQYYALKQSGFFDRYALLVEMIPRLDRRPRYLGEPFARFLDSKNQARLLRSELRDVAGS